MIPNYGMYPQQMQRLNYLESQVMPPNMIKGRPVASIEEVRALPIDFDGSIFYFPDMSNNKIYTKQIGLNGQSILQVYSLTELPVAEVKYVTKEEFNLALNELTAKLEQIKQGGTDDDKQQPVKYSF